MRAILAAEFTFVSRFDSKDTGTVRASAEAKLDFSDKIESDCGAYSLFAVACL